MSPAKEPPADSLHEIATVRIELVDSKPLIWREVEVPTSATLKVLHDIIQAVMGWTQSHLWEFTIGKEKYGPPQLGGWGETEPRKPAGKVRLRDVLKPRRTAVDYLYDFGDSWEHKLVVTKARPGDLDVLYPRYVRGARNGPPEDCGGLPGFYCLLDALADPKHPDHADAMEWAGDYDPAQIDEEPITYALLRIARRRNAAKASKDKPARSLQEGQDARRPRAWRGPVLFRRR